METRANAKCIMYTWNYGSSLNTNVVELRNYTETPMVYIIQRPQQTQAVLLATITLRG